MVVETEPTIAKALPSVLFILLSVILQVLRPDVATLPTITRPKCTAFMKHFVTDQSLLVDVETEP